jgi:predicted carbohydrate-binding protein with CBM5 and CBM33 domain
MATKDPMCWRAWQANPNAMWNWNGLYRENLKGNHQGNIPDGQLCSGGHAESGRYNSLDAVAPGRWRTSPTGSP